MYHGFCNKFVHVCYLDLLLWVSSSFRDPQRWILQFFFLFLNCWDYFEWKFWCWKWHCLSSCGNLSLCSFFKSTVSFFRKSVLFWRAFFSFSSGVASCGLSDDLFLLVLRLWWTFKTVQYCSYRYQQVLFGKFTLKVCVVFPF